MTTLAGTLRVLVVDDELLLRWSIAEVLRHGGHHVIEAASAAAAREAIRDSAPIDVVLLDFRLPDSDDLQLLGEIRHRLPEAAVVLMTAFGTPEVTEGAMRLGAYTVLTKPFDLHGVDAMVRSAHQAARPH